MCVKSVARASVYREWNLSRCMMVEMNKYL